MNSTLTQLLVQVIDIVNEISEEQERSAEPGANFYPAGITREEFERAATHDPELTRFDTVIERMPGDGLRAVPYHIRYQTYYRRMIPLLSEAGRLSTDIPFQRYLGAVIGCLSEGTPKSYQTMMHAWLNTKESPICFPFTYDETYSDRFMGIKGVFDAAVFYEDPGLTQMVSKPLETWDSFVQTLTFPGTPRMFGNLYAKVYKTIVLGGSLPSMQLRAWNLPNDYTLRSEVGAHQIIIEENTLRSFHHELLSMVHHFFDVPDAAITVEMLRTGLFQTLTAHELGHNLGCYEARSALGKYTDVYEELKANLYPILWIGFCESRGWVTPDEKRAAVIIYLALDIMDCVLARKVKARAGYALAALIQFNYLKEFGSLRIDGDRLVLDYTHFTAVHSALLMEVLEIMRSGDYGRAESFAQRYGSMGAFGPLVDGWLKTVTQ